MKNLLMGLIAFLLLGIFLFLGILVFTSDTETETEETVVAETSTDEEASVNDNASDDLKTEKIDEEPVVEENKNEEDDESENNDAVDALQLEKRLMSQEVVVEDVQYIIQDNEYKNLYPDMLSAIIKNNSTTDIRDITYGFVAWDENGLPVRIKGNIDFSNGSYLYGGTGESVNIAPGEIHGKDYGFDIDKDVDEIHSFKAIITEYEGFNGEIWENPLSDDFLSVYEGKRLVDIEGHEDTIVYRFGEPYSDSDNTNEDETSDSSNNQEAEVFITEYLHALEEAYSTDDFSVMENYLIPGSEAYNQIENNMVNDAFPNLTIYSIEVLSYTHLGNNIYIEVLSDGTHDNLGQVYEFKTGYSILDDNGVWMINGFRDL